MNDPTESARRQRVAELNQGDTNRAELEKQYGQVWSTDEMTSEFHAIGFMFCGMEAAFSFLKRHPLELKQHNFNLSRVSKGWWPAISRQYGFDFTATRLEAPLP